MKDQSLPIYWRSSIGDVDEVLKLVKRGVVTKAGESAGKRPIYRVEYGKSNIKHGKANLSSALGAHDVRFYADKTGDDYVPTLFLIGSVHGGEFEGTMALVNLIKIMETGTDYAGVEHPELLSVMEIAARSEAIFATHIAIVRNVQAHGFHGRIFNINRHAYVLSEKLAVFIAIANRQRL